MYVPVLSAFSFCRVENVAEATSNEMQRNMKGRFLFFLREVGACMEWLMLFRDALPGCGSCQCHDDDGGKN